MKNKSKQQQTEKINKPIKQKKELKTLSETSSNRGLNESSDSEFEYYDDDDILLYHMTQKYATFKPRSSILDDLSENSLLKKSQFRGFYNLAMIFGLIMLMKTPFQRYLETGELFSEELYNRMAFEFSIMITTWPLFYCWAHTALILQYLNLKGLPPKLSFFLQHSTQVMMFAYVNFMVLARNWCSTHTGFVTILSCVMFMKMHSYTEINTLYRKDFLKCQNDKTKKPFSNYPQNINFKEFTSFMWIPSLIYDINFPKTDKIRIGYIIKKSFIAFLAMLAGYILLSDHIIPAVEMGLQISYYELIARLVLPLTVFLILVIFINWECILNVFAEISGFTDRQFYKDWWNSTTYEEFNRKWNQPVYSFLYKHVYLISIYKYKRSKKFAQLLTFFFSATLHEWVFALVFRIIRPIMFMFMIQQIPLFILTKHMTGTRQGNILFWWGIVFGVPLIASLYLRSDPAVTELFSRQEI